MKWALVLALIAITGCSMGGRGDWTYKTELFAPPEPVASVESTDTLTVATYNLNWLADPVRLRKSIATASADVWLFQELHLPRCKDDQIPRELADVLPLGDWYATIVRVNPVHTFGDHDEAQAIVSRFPIMRSEVWSLDEPTYSRRRCALVAWLRIGRRELTVVNTDHRPDYLAFDPARGQAANLRSLERQLKQLPNAPTVVGGDFNTCGNFCRLRSSAADAKLAHQSMGSTGFLPALNSLSPTFFRGPVHARLDELYVRGVETSDATIHLDARGSDHRPVACKIRLADP